MLTILNVSNEKWVTMRLFLKVNLKLKVQNYYTVNRLTSYSIFFKIL